MHKKPNLIYHGHLGPERGIEHLVKAMSIVVKTFYEAKLSLLGSFRTKSFEIKVKNLIKDLSLEKNVYIVEQVPYSLVWGILSKNTIGIIPFNKNPSYRELCPYKII